MGERSDKTSTTSSTPPPSPDHDASKTDVKPPDVADIDRLVKKKATSLRVRARYDDVPGVSKTGKNAAKGGGALWFDPLTLAPMSPNAELNEMRVGITKGQGQHVGKFQVPLHESGPGAGSGTGQLTAQLKYASNASASYTVKLDGKFDKGDAAKAGTTLKDYLAGILDQTGDLERVQELAAHHIGEAFPSAKDIKVTLTPVRAANVLEDAGRSEIFYKARVDPTILLNVPVVEVASRVVTSSGATSKEDGHATDEQNYHDQQHDHVGIKDSRSDDTKYHHDAKQTIDDKWVSNYERTLRSLVKVVQDRTQNLTSVLVEKLTKDSTFHDDGKDHYEIADEMIREEDFNKEIKGGEESGNKSKTNWAADLADLLTGVGGILDVVVPVGKVSRKLNAWKIGVDAGAKAANALAVRGTVHYVDSHEDTTAHDKQTLNEKGHADATHSRTVTRVDKGDLGRVLKERFTDRFNSTTTTRLKEFIDHRVTRTGTATQHAEGGQVRVNEGNYDDNRDHTRDIGANRVQKNQNIKTEITYSTNMQETTTRPILEASVVDGDGEVKTTAFAPPGARDA